MKNCTSFLSAFMLTSVLTTGAMAYNMTGDLNLTSDEASYEIVKSFSKNAEDNGITLTGGGGLLYHLLNMVHL